MPHPLSPIYYLNIYLIYSDNTLSHPSVSTFQINQDMLQQPYNSRNHVVGYQNVLSPKNHVLQTNPYRPAPHPYVVPPSTQSHVVQGAVQHHNNYSQQVFIQERSSVGMNRLSADTAIIPGCFVSAQGERECDFKLAGEDFMRIKDLTSQYCYKFRVTSTIPTIQTYPSDSLRLLLTFSGDYIEDLFKFVAALEDPRFQIRAGEKLAVLEFRFSTLEHKNQLIELIHSISKRTSLTHVQTAPTLGNYRSVANLVNHHPQVEPQVATIQSINQGHRSDRTNLQRVQHLNVHQIPEVGVTAFKKIDVPPPVPPPVPLASFPAPQQTITQQETVITQQPTVSISQQQVGSIRASLQATEILRLTQQNRVLNTTLLTIQQESQLVIQQNSRLYAQINNLRQQIQISQSQSHSKVNLNEGEVARLKGELSQFTQTLTVTQNRLREVQNQLALSKTSEAQANNERESQRVTFAKQISDLQTKISTIIGASTGSQTEITSLRRQYQEQKHSNTHLQSELGKLQQLLGEAEKRLYEYQVGFQEVKEQIRITFEEEKTQMSQIIQLKNQEIELLNQRIIEISQQQTVISSQVVDSRQVTELNQQLLLKTQIIEKLESELSNAIHAQGVSATNTNTNLQAVDRMRNHYQEQILRTKTLYESQFQQMNQQIYNCETYIAELEGKYRLLEEMWNRLTVSSCNQYDSAETVEQIRNFKIHIVEMERERDHLIGIIEEYKGELQRRSEGVVIHESHVIDPTQQQVITESVTETVYQNPSHRSYEVEVHQQGGNSDVVERTTYEIQNNNEVVETVTFKTELQGQGIVQVESIERITHEGRTGEGLIESLERVTYPSYEDEQRRVTTYELDQGEERFIHKVTTDSYEGRTVHQVDTNIVVHHQQGEVVYDIETQETTYQGGERYLSNSNQYQQQQYGFVNQPITHQSLSQVSQTNLSQNNNTIYHGDNVNLIYNSRGDNLVIEGGNYEINVPHAGSQIRVTEETYIETNRNPYSR